MSVTFILYFKEFHIELKLFISMNHLNLYFLYVKDIFTVRILKIDIGMLKLYNILWICFDDLYLPRNSSISSKLSNLYIQMALDIHLLFFNLCKFVTHLVVQIEKLRWSLAFSMFISNKHLWRGRKEGSRVGRSRNWIVVWLLRWMFLGGNLLVIQGSSYFIPNSIHLSISCSPDLVSNVTIFLLPSPWPSN